MNKSQFFRLNHWIELSRRFIFVNACVIKLLGKSDTITNIDCSKMNDHKLSAAFHEASGL